LVVGFSGKNGGSTEELAVFAQFWAGHDGDAPEKGAV
jgi:hypothetical protein